MQASKLKEILELHLKWLEGDPAGVRANLTGANLTRANLTRAKLSGAKLSGAKLSGANLTRADLCRADLTRADLGDANLTGANLSWAYLCRAYLCRADLTGANLTWADLTEADLTNSKLPHFQIVPETGAFEGWKKLSGGYIAHVSIPAKAGRVSSTGRKCRAEWVKVLAVYTPMGRKTKKGIGAQMNRLVIYGEGRIVRPDKWDADFRVECTHGIHFFLTRKEAEEY